MYILYKKFLAYKKNIDESQFLMEYPNSTLDE